MKEKGRWFRRLFLIILGVIILLNLAGIIIEGLFTFNVLQTDLVNIRNYTIPGLAISLAFLIAAILLWIKYLRKNRKILIWWHALAIISVLSILYKLIKPTRLVVFVNPPIYFIISLAIIAFLWYLIFKKLKKEYN